MLSFADYFCRNQNAISSEEQHLLQQKKAAVIGCGGLGGYVVEALVRLGVGQIRIFDPDVFSASNCNRQINATVASLGCNKAETAASRSASIHPFSTISAYALDFRDVEEDEAFQVDVIIDCLDTLCARRELAALCNRRDIPMVHGAVNGWHGQVAVQLPGTTLMDHLYPPHAVDSPQPLSVLSFTVTVIAGMQTAEAVKLLLKLPSSLHNSWLHVDLKDGEFLVNRW